MTELSENRPTGETLRVLSRMKPFLSNDKKRLRRLLVNAALWVALCLLLVLGLLNAKTMRDYSSISLRYETPISGESAYKSRLYAISRADTGVFWPVFWHETEIDVKSEYNRANTKCILFSGDASIVWPAQYLAGTTPGVTDGNGCAISSGLAWALWGGFDVTGKVIEATGDLRTVRGVFKGDDFLILLSVSDEDTSQNFTAVELSGGPSSPARSYVENFIHESGLGVPDSILMGTPATMVMLMGLLPILIITVYWFVLCIRWLRSYPATLRGFAWVVVLLVFAILSPILIRLMPEWMLPTRWSDFSFWGSLIRQFSADLKEYLTLSPRLRDVIYNSFFFKQIGIAFLSTCIALSICFRFKQGDGSSALGQ